MTNEIQTFISGAIDRFEGKTAVIKTEDGQEIIWPIKNLPDETAEGSAVRLLLSTKKTDEEEREKLAKTMLNQILKTDD